MNGQLQGTELSIEDILELFHIRRVFDAFGKNGLFRVSVDPIDNTIEFGPWRGNLAVELSGGFIIELRKGDEVLLAAGSGRNETSNASVTIPWEAFRQAVIEGATRFVIRKPNEPK